MYTPVKLVLIILPAMLSFPMTTFAVPVDSISLEVFKDGPQRFWEVSVKCEGLTQARVMLRRVDSNQWCSSEIGSLCNENKFSLSRQLCSDDFSEQVANFKEARPTPIANVAPIDAKPVIEAKVRSERMEKPVTSAPTNIDAPVSTSTAVPNQLVSKENLLKEQMQIEEQRILIEQKRLELRRKQLELHKRQLNAS